MNKLLLVSMLVMLCIASTSASRFLEEAKPQAEVKTKEETNQPPIAPVPVEEKPIVQPTETKQQNETSTTTTSETKTEKVVPQEEKTTDKKVEDKKEEKKEEQKKDEPVQVPIIDGKDNQVKDNKQEETKQEEQKENKEEEQHKKKEEESLPIKVEDNKDTSSYFGLSFGFVLILALGVLFFFAGFYRYSLRKYKIPPFTPPNFCPNFLFPRPENDLLLEDYYIQSGVELGGVSSTEKYHNFY